MTQQQQQIELGTAQDARIADLARRLLTALKDCEDKTLLCVRCDGVVGYDGRPKQHSSDCAVTALIAEAEGVLR